MSGLWQEEQFGVLCDRRRWERWENRRGSRLRLTATTHARVRTATLTVPTILPPLCLGWLHERREKGCE